MSFLIILTYCLVWGLVAWLLAKFLVSFVDRKPIKWMLRSVLFGLIFVAPMVDEIVGRNQFEELCKTEAVIVLDARWSEVKRARRMDANRQVVVGYIVPIHKTKNEYINLDTGEVFLSKTRLGRQGGYIFRKMGIGEVDGCGPPNEYEISKEIDIDRLIKNGSSK